MRLIDADAAIDTLNEQIKQCNKALGSFDISLKDEYAVKVERASLEAYKEQLENMPSIQPDTTTHDSIPVETGKNDGDGISGDCISRQQAIDKFKPWLEVKSYGWGELNMIRAVINELENMPSAQPFHNITLTDVLEYIDDMPEDVWQEFTACLECRGWELQRRTAKWCGGDFA